MRQFIEKYFLLSEKHREICRYLYLCEIKRRRKEFDGVYPSIQKLASFAKCHHRTVTRFNNEVCPELFAILPRFRPNGSHSTNSYLMCQELFDAMNALDRKNMLYEDPGRLKFILFSFENKRVTPPSPIDMSPPYSNPYTKNEEYKYIHPKISKIVGLSTQQREHLSSYSDFLIVKSIEDALWYTEKKNKIDDIFLFLISRIKNTRRKYGIQGVL